MEQSIRCHCHLSLIHPPNTGEIFLGKIACEGSLAMKTYLLFMYSVTTTSFRNVVPVHTRDAACARALVLFAETLSRAHSTYTHATNADRLHVICASKTARRAEMFVKINIIHIVLVYFDIDVKFIANARYDIKYNYFNFKYFEFMLFWGLYYYIYENIDIIFGCCTNLLAWFGILFTLINKPIHFEIICAVYVEWY